MPRSPWSSITSEEALNLFLEEIGKENPDPYGALLMIAGRMNVEPLEVLIQEAVPVDWQSKFLAHAWAVASNYPSMYAGTDTFVKLFERVGFVSDYDNVVRPTEPMTLFRGVTQSGTWLGRGMTWTIDFAKARWFSHRLDHLLDPGISAKVRVEPTIWSAEVLPAGVLALFYAQNELEVVVDPRRLRKLRIIEQSSPMTLPVDDGGVTGIWD